MTIDYVLAVLFAVGSTLCGMEGHYFIAVFFAVLSVACAA